MRAPDTVPLTFPHPPATRTLPAQPVPVPARWRTPAGSFADEWAWHGIDDSGVRS